MAFQIRVSPNALRESADRQRAISASLQELSSRMGALSTALNAAWDGGASIQALGAFAELRDATNAAADYVEDGASKLNAFAQAVESLDDGKPTIVPIARMDIGAITNLLKTPAPSLKGFLLAFSGALRIVPDEVREIAQQLEEVANNLEDDCAQLRNLVDKLANDWEGRAYQKYAEETSDAAAGFRRLAAEVHEFSDRLRTAAMRYEEVDNLF